MKGTHSCLSVLVVWIVISLLLAGCTGIQPRTNSTPPPLVTATGAGPASLLTATPAAGGGGCAEGQTTCSGVCRNTLADAGNCGRCGNSCGASQYCSNGACITGTLVMPSTTITAGYPPGVISCAEGQTVCSGICRNTLADASNCGTCGRVCGSGHVCNSGVCTGSAASAATTTAVTTTTTTAAAASGTHCGAGQINCGGTCVMADAGLTLCGDRCRNLQADAENCGACGHVCPSWQACTAGTCRGCSPGFTECGPGCSNTSIDPVNCGGCGIVCPTGLRCIGGSCMADSSGASPSMTCLVGYSDCGSGCTDLRTDSANCGFCGNACPTGQSCTSGICTGGIVCMSPFTSCGSGCSNLQIDPVNCGSCGITCPDGYRCCLGTCTDTGSNNENCGTCGNACPSGQHCEGYVCVEGPTWVVITPEITTTTCGKGMTLCTGAKGGSACTDLNTDENNCGMCGHVCTTGSCINGECTFFLS